MFALGVILCWLLTGYIITFINAQIDKAHPVDTDEPMPTWAMVLGTLCPPAALFLLIWMLIDVISVPTTSKIIRRLFWRD